MYCTIKQICHHRHPTFLLQCLTSSSTCYHHHQHFSITTTTSPTKLTVTTPSLTNNLHNLHNFQFIRNYAKGKDKKKDTGSNKKTIKIDINEAQINQVLNLDAIYKQMQKIIDQMKQDFIQNLSLRSTTGAIDQLKIHTNHKKGEEYELQELAQISRKNPKTLIINMINFPQFIPDVLNSIEKSGMNLSPQQDGTTIFIPIPKVTKEHRELLIKNAKNLYIKARDQIKNIQNLNIKKLKKNLDISKDENYQIQQQLITITDNYLLEVEQILLNKQNELLGSKD